MYDFGLKDKITIQLDFNGTIVWSTTRSREIIHTYYTYLLKL